MFRLYSKGCEYAIRALVHAAPTKKGERFKAKVICEQAGIPESFTRKVFRALVHGGFLEALRGPGGGYALLEDPDRISLLEIIQAVDGADTFEGCVMGLEVCKSLKPCPLHYAWNSAKNEMLDQLESKTLWDLCEAVRRRESHDVKNQAIDGGAK